MSRALRAGAPESQEANPGRALRPAGQTRCGLRLAAALVQRGEAISCAPLAGSAAGRLTQATLERGAQGPAALAMRGVLLDVARVARRAWLPDGAAIGPAALDTCAERLGVVVEPGDAVLVRTGFLEGCAAPEGERAWHEGAAPGLGLACADWMRDRRVALVATDAPFVAARSPGQQAPALLAHALHDGLALGAGFDLSRLARACATDHEYSHLFVCAAPATRGPVHPLALR